MVKKSKKELLEEFFKSDKSDWYTENEQGVRKWDKNKVVDFWGKIREKNNYNYTYYIFPEFESELYIFKTNKFDGNQNFWNSNSEKSFTSSVDFTNAVFLDKANFNATKFFSNSVFNYSVFHKMALFNNTCFEMLSNFHETCFHNECFFYNSIHNDKAIFTRATFLGDTAFPNSKIHGLCDFQSANFNKNVNFGGTEFYGYVIFLNTVFEKETSFHESVFYNNIVFRNASLNGDFSFSYVTFKRSFIFHRLEFKKNVDFSNINFQNKIEFVDLKFLGEAKFNGCQFSVDSTALFQDIDSKPKLIFKYINFNKNTTFRRVDLSAAIFTQSDITDAKFKECSWDLTPRLVLEEEIDASSEKDYLALESLYRQLKKNFSTEKDIELSGYASISEVEMRKKRFLKEKKYTDFFIYWFYSFFGGSTEDYKTPLKWLFYSGFFIFPLIYFFTEPILNENKVCEYNLMKSFIKSFANSIPILKSKYEYQFWITQSFQLIFSTILLTFFILSLRKRFKH